MAKNEFEKALRVVKKEEFHIHRINTLFGGWLVWFLKRETPLKKACTPVQVPRAVAKVGSWWAGGWRWNPATQQLEAQLFRVEIKACRHTCFAGRPSRLTSEPCFFLQAEVTLPITFSPRPTPHPNSMVIKPNKSPIYTARQVVGATLWASTPVPAPCRRSRGLRVEGTLA